MQPHSISALGVAWHIFGKNYATKIPKSVEVQIDWKTTEGRSRSLFHYISAVDILKKDRNGYITEVRIPVKTTDGTPCTLTVVRRSDGEFKQGEELVATHSVQHVAGLEEHYWVSRGSIRGHHHHSRKYGSFSTSSVSETSFLMTCSVRIGSSEKFMNIPYSVKVKVGSEERVKEIEERERRESEMQAV